MKNHIPAILLAAMCFMLLTAPAGAQLFNGQKRSQQLYEQALKLAKQRKGPAAMQKLYKALEADSTNADAHRLLGDLFYKKGNRQKEAFHYQKAAGLNGDAQPQTYYFAADALLATGQYADAVRNFERYQQSGSLNARQENIIKRKLGQARFGKAQKADPVDFSPQNLGPQVNSRYDEYTPALTADERTLIITRAVPIIDELGRKLETVQEDFYQATRTDSGWLEAIPLDDLNTKQNEGAQTISADGRMMVFTACSRRDGYGSCDLYIAFRKGEKWGRPHNLSPNVNSHFWESQPALSADGKELFFVSNSSQGYGKMDIWYTRRLRDGSWDTPTNLGKTINTAGNEMTPFLHADNRSLYFASDQHLGMGGQDLYRSVRDTAGNWGKPENLGYPINTFRDETGLIINSRGNRAYYSSDRFNSLGKLDMYSFELPEPLRPTLTAYLKGRVYDAQTRQPLDAQFSLTALATDSLLHRSGSDARTGEFLISLPAHKRYALIVRKPGYLLYSDHFDMTGYNSKSEPFEKDIPLEPIEAGKTITLKNIFFKVDEYDLQPESQPELNTLKQFMEINPKLKIEIQGHTDNQGTAAYNQELSEKRAEVVYNYLVDAGISPGRMQYKGYGMDNPIADNSTEKGRSRNRRTVVEILE